MPPFKSSLSTSAMHAKHCFWCPKERTSILQFGQCPKENVQFLTKYDRFSHFTWLRVCIKVSRSITSSLQPCQANFVTFAQLSQFCPFLPFLLVRGHTARLVWTFSHFWNTFGRPSQDKESHSIWKLENKIIPISLDLIYFQRFSVYKIHISAFEQIWQLNY